MRANQFIIESAVRELADILPTLKKTDYNAIDRLMKRVGIKHSVSSKKLHNMFVSKYGHSPDHWVKKIKSRLGETDVDPIQDDNSQQMKDFIQWAFKELNMQEPHPKFHFSTDTEAAQENHRTGVHDEQGNITVYIANRNLVDICRTIFHELVHHRQDQLGMIEPGDSYPGSPIEAMADMMAGKYIKIYGKEHPEIFQ